MWLGALRALLDSIPYLLTNGLVPPLRVLNTVLRMGSEEAGMSGGCSWEPFELTTGEFHELVDELEARPSGGSQLRFVEPPKRVTTPKEWHVWCAEHLQSIPSEENRRLLTELEDLEAAMRQAISLLLSILQVRPAFPCPIPGSTQGRHRKPSEYWKQSPSGGESAPV